MSSFNLPVILVSASDNIAATKIISELIDNEVEEKTYKEAGWRVWLLDNKYYTARVRFEPLPDGDAASSPRLRAQAHLIYLTDNEGAATAEARRNRAASLLASGAVRLTLLEAARPSETLVSWALRARHEVVALRAAPGEAAEEGVARARAALHAHVWPGLRRRGAALARSFVTDDAESSDGSVEEDEEERAVERAEAFADALGVLSALGAQDGAGEAHDGLRRERAEQLVAAFCRALGHDLHSC